MVFIKFESCGDMPNSREGSLKLNEVPSCHKVL